MSPPCHFLLQGLNKTITLVIQTKRLSHSDIKKLDHFIEVTLYLTSEVSEIKTTQNPTVFFQFFHDRSQSQVRVVA